MLVCWRLDRLGRNLRHLHGLLDAERIMDTTSEAQ